MAEDSRWRVGTLISTRTFTKSAAEVASILEWFMLDKAGPAPEGLTPAQLNQFRLDEAHDAALNFVKREAYRNRLRQLQAAQDVEGQADNETTL